MRARVCSVEPLGAAVACLLFAVAGSAAAQRPSRDWSREDRTVIGDFSHIRTVAAASDRVFATSPTALLVWLPHFERWGDLRSAFRGLVKVAVERALPVTSPAYDRGATEAELRSEWQAYYLGLAETSGHRQP